MLNVENVEFRYRNQANHQPAALQGVSFLVQEPQIVVLLGLSGSGKSTLIRCLNGALVPQRGRIVVQGMDLHGSARCRRRCQHRMGTVYQNHALVQRQTARQNVLKAFVSTRPWLASFLPPGSGLQAQALAMLDLVGLGDHADQRVDLLSGGQRQRVGIARALANHPALVLADEPVASLDPQTGGAVLELLRRLQRRLGLMAVVSLHQPEQARTMADRVIGIRAGNLVFDVPSHAVNQSLLKAIYDQPVRRA
ncbi:MAG: ATP-binding cassette domain-containing protein [Synechococcus sp. SB0668_bin_15]|nr:ATP-binding cassette domain-containing protein [Synechococcus sp. SB0668_bin_15]MYC49929.1 ATP-binding cassette domain-containing protein [Synechococcus sp. SB0662_bin_14]